MGEIEKLTVKAITELKETIATQRDYICILNIKNDELQAKLDKVRQIVNNYDGSTPSMIKQFSEIQKVLGKE